jgi:putative flippase GtrA
VRGALECAFLDEFLWARGYTFQSIKQLTKARREALLRGAAAYATLKLAEIAARALFVKDLER